MFGLRLFCRPRVDDWAPLAKFFYANEALETATNELDALDAGCDPDHLQQIVSQLRGCQGNVIQIIEEMLNEVWPCGRARRDFRVKFPDDIILENLPGQLWFGAQSLAGGSNIVEREAESESLRPVAKMFVIVIDTLRRALKQQSLKNVYVYPDQIRFLLRQFDVIYAQFELKYVSAMVPVKSAKEYDMLLDVAVMFSETLQRAMERGYITQAMVDYYDPNVMITVPRLAIIHGLLRQDDGPLCVGNPPEQLPEMFRNFRSFLQEIQELLQTLSDDELITLERLLSSQENFSAFADANMFLMADYRTGEKQSCWGKKKCSGDSSKSSADAEDQIATMPHAVETLERACQGRDIGAGSANNDDDCSMRDAVSSTYASLSSSPSEDDGEISVRIAVVSDNPARRESVTPDVEITYSGLVAPAEPSGTSGKDGQSSRNNLLRSRFQSPQDLLHRLFVCIAGVADQLQSSYPSDIRAVLKMVLRTGDVAEVYEVPGKTANGNGRGEEMGMEVVAASSESVQETDTSNDDVKWVPDSECTACCGCQATFTLVRRRHHCRNCGNIFCDQCSRNSVPLPNHGYTRPVRVCNQCFFYKLTPLSGDVETTTQLRNRCSSTNANSSETSSPEY